MLADLELYTLVFVGVLFALGWLTTAAALLSESKHSIYPLYGFMMIVAFFAALITIIQLMPK